MSAMMSAGLTGSLQQLKDKWWAILLRGILLIILGVFFIVDPKSTTFSVAVVFGIFAIADGIMALISGVKGIFGEGSWFGYLLQGIISLLAGVIALTNPEIFALTIYWLIAFWAIFAGVARIINAIVMRKQIDNEFLMILAGVFWIGFGVYLLSQPKSGSNTVTNVIGIMMILGGILEAVLSFKIKNLDVEAVSKKVNAAVGAAALGGAAAMGKAASAAAERRGPVGDMAKQAEAAAKGAAGAAGSASSQAQAVAGEAAKAGNAAAADAAAAASGAAASAESAATDAAAKLTDAANKAKGNM